MTYSFCSNLRPPPNDTSSVMFGTASCFMALYAQPATCICGLLLNWTCIYVFCSKTKSHSLGVHLVPYLIALCCFDSAQLLLSVFVLNLPVVQQYIQTNYYNQLHEWILLNEVSVYSVKYLMPLMMAVNYCSVWTITAISVERFKAICHPFGSLPDRPGLTIFMVLGGAFALNFVRYWEYELKQMELLSGSLRITYLVATELKKNQLYQIFMDTVLYATFVYFVPIVTLTYLNVRILRQIWSTRQLVRTTNKGMLTRKKSKGMKRSENNHLRSAIMVITIVLVFFVCHTGGLIVRIALNDDQWKVEHYLLFHFLSDLSNLLININSTIDPLLYFVFTRKFRDLTRESRRKETTTDTRTDLRWTTMASRNSGLSAGKNREKPRSASIAAFGTRETFEMIITNR